MIIVHENLPIEARVVAESLNEVYGIPSEIVNHDLTHVFKPLPKFSGFYESDKKLRKYFSVFKKRKVMVITPRDIYEDKINKEDDWVFSYGIGKLTLVSTARIKRNDTNPSNVIKIPKEKYFRRLEALAIHEVGHDVVDNSHFKEIKWVNKKTGRILTLDYHCVDNTCVMSQSVNIRDSHNDDGYMLIGKKREYKGAGLDDFIERKNPSWFCDDCNSSIKISKKYM